MLQQPLSDRLNQLPLILAGPMLRRTESQAVTVWLALQKASMVNLKIYATENGQGEIISNLILAGSRPTVELGKYLHIVAVTAKPINHSQLSPGQVYAYDLNFTCAPLQSLNSALGFPAISEQHSISYFPHQLPTFALPPIDLNHLRIVHGSCRKPHGGGRDALPILDNLIQESPGDANSRPHQVFLTGDQIYADDVADALLWMVSNAGDVLLGWEENLPLIDSSKKPSEFKPGKRNDIARDLAGLTAMLINKPDKAKSHLFSLGEYFAMYLFVWSPTIWPSEFPQGKDIGLKGKQAKLWDQETDKIEKFFQELWKVRRAIANVPIYTICDDHDVSDDWYLNREWCNRVLSKPLGRRVVQNAMLAYAVFQAWGNTPDQFEEKQPGSELLAAAKNWSASAGKDEYSWEKIGKYLGIPPLETNTGLPEFKQDQDVLVLSRDYDDNTPILTWHYTISSLKHEVIVLDTRTWRGYPTTDTTTPAMLLCHREFETQIEQPLMISDRLKASGKSNIEVTMLLLPTNLVSLSIIDMVQHWDLEQGKIFNSDAGDSWNFHEVAFTKLLSTIFKRRDRVVILTGDIHYAAAVRFDYWTQVKLRPETHILANISDSTSQEKSALNYDLPRAKYQSSVLAQLTASAFKNAEWKTSFIHTKAQFIIAEQPQEWMGWNLPPQLLEIVIAPEFVRIWDLELPKTGPILRQIQGICGNGEIAWTTMIKDAKILPDLQYRIEWIKREQAKFSPWSQRQNLLKSTEKPESIWSKDIGDLVSLLWKNRWLQEGEQIIGHSNLGLISFQWFTDNNHPQKAVIQDIYWYALWQKNSVVYSRYFVSLDLNELPPYYQKY
jgi:hypothetical protein